jgi:hypothetical protein
MEQVVEKSKDYEFIVSKFSQSFEELVEGIEIVKEFIIKKNLIIYGGSAIDYALRLKGDKIYPDNLLIIPDLDMYSPNSISDSYELADILYHKGFPQSRAISAQHVETMRVDIMNNNFIADISYRPQEIFDKLPYLTYNGMRIIHPEFQRLDMHSALSFPFDDVPREVIFARWNKDIVRFNILSKYYPIDVQNNPSDLRKIKFPDSIKGFVFTGFIAYAIYYNKFAKLMKEKDIKIPDEIVKASLIIDDGFTFETLDNKLDLIHYEYEKVLDVLLLKNVKKYEPYINLIPQTVVGDLDGNKVIIHNTKNKLISINSLNLSHIFDVVSENKIRIVNIQPLLKYYLSQKFINKDTKFAHVYIARYVSLLKMIDMVEKHSNMEKADLFYPSINVYGKENINIANEFSLNRLYSDIDEIKQLNKPINYNAQKNILKETPHPKIEPENIEHFNQSGREIIDSRS